MPAPLTPFFTDDQHRNLVSFITEDFGANLTRDAFVEIALDLFEDIAGFELANETDIQSVLTILWSCYMSTDNTITTDKVPTNEPAVPANPVQYDAAIVKAKEILAAGGTKADAARAVYEMIRTEDREILLRAMRDGAVTEKGAPTYLYNVTRWFKKSQSAKTAPARAANKKTRKTAVVPAVDATDGAADAGGSPTDMSTGMTSES